MQSLSYLASQEIIIFEWASAIHETPIKEFVRATQNDILSLPYPTSLISIQLEQNECITGINTDSAFIPDTSLEFSSKVCPCLNQYQAILEVAFSQPWESVLQKVKEIVAEYPEILMVTIVNITERKYQFPEPDSEAW